MKKFIVLVLMVVGCACPSHAENYHFDMPSEANEVVGFYTKNKDMMVGYIEGQRSVSKEPLPETMMAIVMHVGGKEPQIYTIETLEDVPDHSVRADCSDSKSVKDCWFIKYSDDEEVDQ